MLVPAMGLHSLHLSPAEKPGVRLRREARRGGGGRVVAVFPGADVDLALGDEGEELDRRVVAVEVVLLRLTLVNADAGIQVVDCDVLRELVQHSRNRVKGDFVALGEVAVDLGVGVADCHVDDGPDLRLTLGLVLLEGVADNGVEGVVLEHFADFVPCAVTFRPRLAISK